VYDLWFLCSDFVYCILFPQLCFALFDKKANTWGSVAGFFVAVTIRFSGGDPTLGLVPWFDWFDMIDKTNGLVLFPFRTLAMVSSLLTIFTVSRLSQKACPPTPLKMPEQAS
jgi:high affinity choline transporter 7